MEPKVLRGYRRHDIAELLDGNGNLGVELGVAEGIFSERMMRSGKFKQYIGVDMYAAEIGHNTAEYKRALMRVGLDSHYKLLRMRFDEALDLFGDETLDFVYIDGYAHGGEEGGETIFSWYRKVKIGGHLAGDDYHSDWPLVGQAVDELVRQSGEELMLTEVTEPDNPYCLYPTWCVRKSRRAELMAPAEMIRRGKRENARVARAREGGRLRKLVPWLVPAPIIERLSAVLKRRSSK
jgi:hypothetical protein